MFVVRQLNNKYRLHSCTENVFLNYHFSMENAIMSSTGLRSDTENLGGGILKNWSLHPKYLSPKGRKGRIYVTTLAH